MKNKIIRKSIKEELTWHWFIVLGGFLAYMIADGCSLSVGVLYSEFLDAFEMGKSQTATIPGLIFGLPLLLACIASPLVETYGCTNCSIASAILLSISFLVSSFSSSLTLISIMIALFACIGLELAYVAALIGVTKAFPPDPALHTHKTQRRHAFAVGLTVAGSGVGSMVFNPLIATMIRNYFWRNAMMIQAAIFLHLFISAALFRQIDWRPRLLNRSRSLRNEKTIQDEVEFYEYNEPTPPKCSESLLTSLKGLLHKDLWTNPSFLFFTLAGALVDGAFTIPWSFNYDYALQLGLDSSEAASLLVIMGITFTLGQVIFGAIGDYVDSTLLWSLIQLAGAVSLFCNAFISSKMALFILCGLMALFNNMCLYPQILTHLVGEKLSYAALGLYLTFTGIVALLTPPLAGYLNDVYGSYLAPFLLSSAMVAIAGVIGILLYIYHLFKKKSHFFPESLQLN